jgi:hypothetical protein
MSTRARLWPSITRTMHSLVLIFDVDIFIYTDHYSNSCLLVIASVLSFLLSCLYCHNLHMTNPMWGAEETWKLSNLHFNKGVISVGFVVNALIMLHFSPLMMIC